MTTAIIGPIEVAKSVPERSGAQIITSPHFDSRTKDRRVIPYEIIRKIKAEPTIALARMVVLSNFIHTPWDYETTIRAPSEAKNEIMDMMEEIRNEFLMLSVYGALDYGWAPFEISYKRSRNFAVINKLKPLLQDFTDVLVYTNSGDFAGLINEPLIIGQYDNAVVLKEIYSCVFNLEWEGTDWYGESVYNGLQSVYNSWNDVEKVSSRYDRKISGALWVIHFPNGITRWNNIEKSNDLIAQDILSRLEGSAGISIPSDIQEFLNELDSVDKKMKGKWEIELITSSTSQQSHFIDRQKYLDALKMRAFGLPERSVLEGTHGTKAEADTHTDIALGTIGVKHALICSRLNSQVINNALRLNWGPEAINTVKAKPAPIIEARFNIIKEAYRLILSNDAEGIEAANIDKQQLRKMLGIPDNKDEDVEKELVILRELKKSKELDESGVAA